MSTSVFDDVSPYNSDDEDIPPPVGASGRAQTAPSQAFSAGVAGPPVIPAAPPSTPNQPVPPANPTVNSPGPYSVATLQTSAPVSLQTSAPVSLQTSAQAHQPVDNKYNAVTPIQGTIPGSAYDPTNKQYTYSRPDPTKMQGAGTQVLSMRPYGKTFIVSGQTKDHRLELKKLGKASWTPRPTDGGEMGWRYLPADFDKVLEYVMGANQGTIAAPAPSVPTQTVHWEIFRPEKNMKLKLHFNGQAVDYVVADLIQDGWLVVGATIYQAQNPQQVSKIVIKSGQWQINCWDQVHHIEALLS